MTTASPTDRPPHLRIMITIACFVVIVAGLRAASGILVPFLLSIFIAIILTPFMFWLQRKGISRILAITVIILLLAAIGVIMVKFVGEAITGFTASLPTYQQRLLAKLGDLVAWLNARGIAVSKQMVLEHFDPGMAMQMVAKTLTSLSGVLANTFLILLTVIFILMEASELPAKLRAAVKDPEKSMAGVSSFIDSVNHYMALKTIFSLTTGLLVWLWLTILGVDFAIVWGLVAFLLNYVPNIGSIIAAIPAVLLAFVQLGAGYAALTILGYLVVNISIGSILEPRFMGSGLGLSTLVVFLSLVFWGWVLGPVGMLLSVPLTMIFKIAMESSEETRWLSAMLGNKTTGGQPPAD